MNEKNISVALVKVASVTVEAGNNHPGHTDGELTAKQGTTGIVIYTSNDTGPVAI